MGLTKLLSLIYLLWDFLDLEIVPVRLLRSDSYLTRVAAAKYQIWTWYSIGQCFGHSWKRGKYRIGGYWFSKPRPWTEWAWSCHAVDYVNAEKNGCNLAGDIFKCISAIKFWFKFRHALSWMNTVVLWFWLKFIPKYRTDDRLVMVQVMACSQTGDKPLPKPVMSYGHMAT